MAAEAPGATLLARLATSGAGSTWSLAGKFGADPAEVFAILDLRRASSACRLPSRSRRPAARARTLDRPHRHPRPVICAVRRRAPSVVALDLGGAFRRPHAVRPARRWPCTDAPLKARLHRQLFGAHRSVLIAEPGRALVGDAGVLEGARRRAPGRTPLVYLEQIFNGFLTETLGEAIHYRLRTRPGAPAAAVLAGPTCDSSIAYARCVDLLDTRRG